MVDKVILPKKEHWRLGSVLGELLKDVEHFRIKEENKHVAVVCLTDGSCWWGESVCSPKDHYKRSVGHTIAVGRALREAVDRVVYMDGYVDFYIDPDITKKDLRDACRRELVERGVMPESTLHHTDKFVDWYKPDYTGEA